jgi:TonB-linked SusC/RagA family outer membrane protein
VPKGSVISVSFLGYLTREVVLGENRALRIALQEDNRQLDEVVVIGYGTLRQKEVTSSISHLGSEDFNPVSVQSPLELIQGKVAGLNISKGNADPNESPNMMMRGISSYHGSQSPLVVVDGVPGASLSHLANDDIESIDVLKDGSAAAIYGTRGTNGVIIVNTKQGKSQNAKIDYNGYLSVGSIMRMPKVLTRDEFLSLGEELGVEAKDWGYETDWLSETLDNKHPVSHSHNLSLTGGTAKHNYRMSFNYRNSGALVKYVDRPDYGGRLNVNHKGLNNKLFISADLAAQISTSHPADYSVMEKAVRMNPTAPIMDPDNPGKYFEPGGDEYNPVGMLDQMPRETNRSYLSGNIKATLEIIHGLQLKTMYAQRRNHTNEKQYDEIDSYHSVKELWNGRARQRNSTSWNQQLDLTLNYHFKAHNNEVTLLGGYSYEDSNSERFTAENYGFLSDGFAWNSLEQGSWLTAGKASMDSKKSMEKLIAFFGRLNYAYFDTYLLQASFRYEGSTKFGVNNRWGLFPAISAGWRVSNEDFLKNHEWVNDLKLRAGFGLTGNQGFSSYISQTTIGLIKNSDFSGLFYDASQGKWIQGYGPNSNANPDFRWEQKHEYNIGLDFNLFHSRLCGSIDFYNRITKDLVYEIYAPSPPYITDTYYSNVGQMSNKGFELTLTGIPLKTKDFSWEVSTSFSIFKNNIDKLNNESGDVAFWDEEKLSGLDYVFRWQVGHPVSQFYGYRFAGFTEDGKWLMYNKNNEVVSWEDVKDEDKTFLGNGLPLMNIGLNNTFKYKNLTLSFFLRGDYLFKILNEKDLYYGNKNKFPTYNVLTSAIDKHKQLNDKPFYSDYYLENGDFTKLDNVTLGYDFKLGNNPYIKKLHLYVSAKNLFYITSYSGIDPELNRDPLVWGRDKNSFYPQMRTFTFGTKITFN